MRSILSSSPKNPLSSLRNRNAIAPYTSTTNHDNHGSMKVSTVESSARDSGRDSLHQLPIVNGNTFKRISFIPTMDQNNTTKTMSRSLTRGMTKKMSKSTMSKRQTYFERKCMTAKRFSSVVVDTKWFNITSKCLSLSNFFSFYVCHINGCPRLYFLQIQWEL